MDGRAFLKVAKELMLGGTEAHWRAAAGRAYYALMLESRAALERWGFRPPKSNPVHAYIRLRFVYAAEPDLKEIGRKLEANGLLRNQADYHLVSSGRFTDASWAAKAIRDAEVNIARLDQIEADPQRRAAAIAAIDRTGP